MGRLPFVIWMLGWPLVSTISDYLDFLRGERFSDDCIAISTIISMAIWVAVAAMLWRAPPHPSGDPP